IFAPVLAPRDWTKAIGWDLARDVTSTLQITTRDVSEYGTTVSRKPATAINIEGYRKMWQVRLYYSRGSAWNPSHQDDIALGLENGVLKVETAGSQRQQIPLESVYQRLDSGQPGQLPAEQLTADFQQGTRSFRLIFESITFHRESNGIVFNNCELYLLEK